ncbi:MAG: ankyrin repeat domain-containing protein, partial [Pseudomonadota bacterium]
LVYEGYVRGDRDITVGVVCHTPYQAGPGGRAVTEWGDSISADEGDFRQRYRAYAKTFNRTMVDDPAFPYADICRPLRDDDGVRPEWSGNYTLIGGPARVLTRKPLTLHEAARRGSAAQVRAFLRRQNVDDLDVFGMTALTWAVAHGRDEIVAVLLAAGASPTPELPDSIAPNPVLAAVTQSRVALFKRLSPEPLSARFVDEAIRSADPAMVRAVFAMPHQAPRLDWLGEPSAEVAAIVIDHEGKRAADAFLAIGADKSRSDLVQLAIARGADVNIPNGAGELPLVSALDRYRPETETIVAALLAAGADPNRQPRPGHGETALWRAYEHMDELTGARSELLRLMLRSGGDASVDWWPDVPSAWAVVFRVRWDLTQPRPPSLEILRLLHAAGMDLNAPYKGQCLLDALEMAVGRDAQAVRDLKTLGAKRRAASGKCSRAG